MNIEEKTKDILDYYSGALLNRSHSLFREYTVHIPTKVIFKSNVYIMAVGDSVPDHSIMIGLYSSDGTITGATIPGSVIKENMIRDIGKHNWTLATYTTIGHADGYPNILTGSAIIHIPKSIDPGTVMSYIKKFIPAGNKIFIKSYEGNT